MDIEKEIYIKTPMARPHSWNFPLCLAVVVVTLAAVLIMLVRSEFALTHYELPLLRLDGMIYLQVAQGNHQNISSPFSRRVLYPGLAHVLSMATGASLRYTFFFLSILSFSLLAYSLAWIFTIFGLSPWLIAVCLLTPFPVVGLEMGYMPDLFSAALTALCFLFLLQERHLLALVTLAICFPARENTLVVCVILGVIAWLRNQPKLAGGALLVIILGSALGTWFVRLGSPNIHHLPDFAYLLFKAPHQFLKNVLGIRIWVNTLPVGNPWITFALPPTLCWGEVREVGICPFEWTFPAYTSLTLLIIFGTMPVLLWKARHLRLWSNRYPLAIQVATWTGAVGYLLGTSLGDSVDRLIGYGWSLFWIVGPYVIANFIRNEDRKNLPWFYLILVALTWIPEITNYSRWTSGDISIELLIAAITALAYLISWRLLPKVSVS